jgi:TonB family protein
MKKMFQRFGVVIFGSFLFVVLIASLVAYDPKELRLDEIVKREKIKVKLNEPQKTEEPPPEPEKAPQESLLSTLAPDSFAATQDLGGGVGFGSGGFGPAIGGGGGFGSDSAQLSREKDNINRPPRLVMKSPPDYPSEARQNSVSGYVMLKILVSASGSVDNVQIEKSEPVGVFDASATRSVRTWKFEPAIVKGQIVAAWTMQKIKFELN